MKNSRLIPGLYTTIRGLYVSPLITHNYDGESVFVSNDTPVLVFEVQKQFGHRVRYKVLIDENIYYLQIPSDDANTYMRRVSD